VQLARTRRALNDLHARFSPPFGTPEAKDKGEEVVPCPYVPSTPPEELRRSRATPSSFGNKEPPLQPHIGARPYRFSPRVRTSVIPSSIQARPRRVWCTGATGPPNFGEPRKRHREQGASPPPAAASHPGPFISRSAAKIGSSPYHFADWIRAVDLGFNGPGESEVFL
jgi:hypothetical protein